MQTFGDAVRQRAKTLLARPASPVVGYFDRQFQRLRDHFDGQISQLYDRVATEVETISELTLGMERFVDITQRTVDAMLAKVDGLLESVDARARGGSGLDRAVAERMADLTEGDGLLVLSVPSGRPTDGGEHLSGHLPGWAVVEQNLYPVDDSTMIALVVLRPEP